MSRNPKEKTKGKDDRGEDKPNPKKRRERVTSEIDSNLSEPCSD